MVKELGWEDGDRDGGSLEEGGVGEGREEKEGEGDEGRSPQRWGWIETWAGRGRSVVEVLIDGILGTELVVSRSVFRKGPGMRFRETLSRSVLRRVEEG